MVIFPISPKVGQFHENLGISLDDNSSLDVSQQQKILTKAFQIKRFSWSTCSKLINRHKLLIDIRAGSVATVTDTSDFTAMAEQANSKILTSQKLAEIISILPPRFTVQKIEQIYSTIDDGYALSTGELQCFVSQELPAIRCLAKAPN